LVNIQINILRCTVSRI